MVRWVSNRYFVWFDINNAEAITTSGQLSIQWISNALNAYLDKICKTSGVDRIIANDTDSAYVRLDDLVDSVFKDQSDVKGIVKWINDVCKLKIVPTIDKNYQDLADRMCAYKQKMRMKMEFIADKAIWTAKKRYIMNVWNKEGVAYDEPKIKMTGIEAVKSSTPQSCRDALKKSFKIIMSQDESSLQSYISSFKEEFKDMKFEAIAFPRGVSNITQYEVKGDDLYASGTPIHVKGSILYNRLMKDKGLKNKYENIANGDKIKFAYLKQPNPHHTNVISSPGELPSEFEIDKYIDYEIQFKKAFVDPLSIILDKIGWEAEKRSTLDSFFG